MPENVVRVYRSLLLPNRMGELVLNNHFDGMQYAIKNAVMMVTMTERDDIDVTMSNNATIPDEFREEKVSLFIYDKYEGGLGYSEKIYDLIPEILEKQSTDVDAVAGATTSSEGICHAVEKALEEAKK